MALKRGRFMMGLIGVVALSACSTAGSAADLSNAHMSDVIPPAEYAPYDHALESYKATALELRLEVDGQATESNCPDNGVGAMWVWTRGGRAGDPTFAIYLCDAQSAEIASRVFVATPLERTLPELGKYRASEIDADRLALSADEAATGCVWGEPSECRAWTYLARYGQYLVTSYFVIAADQGKLNQDGFERSIRSLDTVVEGFASGA